MCRSRTIVFNRENIVISTIAASPGYIQVFGSVHCHGIRFVVVAVPRGGLGGSAHRIEIRLDLRDVMFVIAALVLFLLARMLDEAARLDRELKEFV